MNQSASIISSDRFRKPTSLTKSVTMPNHAKLSPILSSIIALRFQLLNSRSISIIFRKDSKLNFQKFIDVDLKVE